MKYDKSMMATAHIWAKESYCKRRQVGAVIAKENRILSTGYNGTVNKHENICEEYTIFKNDEEFEHFLNKYNRKDPPILRCKNCIDGIVYTSSSHPYKEDYECSKCNGIGYLKLLDRTNEFTVHAEQNAIAFCAKHGIPVIDTTLYVTTAPCKQCAKLIKQSGIIRVVYEEDYHDTEGIDFLEIVGIEVNKLSKG